MYEWIVDIYLLIQSEAGDFDGLRDFDLLPERLLLLCFDAFDPLRLEPLLDRAVYWK